MSVGTWTRYAALVVVVVSGPSCVLWTNRHCVVEGTGIDTPDGRVAVELLGVGDAVLSRAPDGTLRAGRIEAIHVGFVSEVTVLDTDSGARLEASTRHLVWTDRGWVAAAGVGAGAQLVALDGAVRSVRVRNVAKRMRVFDLSVSPDQNYFAGGILVHNKSLEDPTGSKLAPGKKKEPPEKSGGSASNR